MGPKSTAIYKINYNFVWCLKQRKPLFEEKGVKEFMEDLILTIAASHDHEVLLLEVLNHHIRLSITAQPFQSPLMIIKRFKGTSVLRFFKKFPELKDKYWKGKLWAMGYYVSTQGTVSMEAIQQYIDSMFSNEKV